MNETVYIIGWFVCILLFIIGFTIIFKCIICQNHKSSSITSAAVSVSAATSTTINDCNLVNYDTIRSAQQINSTDDLGESTTTSSNLGNIVSPTYSNLMKKDEKTTTKPVDCIESHVHSDESPGFTSPFESDFTHRESCESGDRYLSYFIGSQDTSSYDSDCLANLNSNNVNDVRPPAYDELLSSL